MRRLKVRLDRIIGDLERDCRRLRRYRLLAWGLLWVCLASEGALFWGCSTPPRGAMLVLLANVLVAFGFVLYSRARIKEFSGIVEGASQVRVVIEKKRIEFLRHARAKGSA